MMGLNRHKVVSSSKSSNFVHLSYDFHWENKKIKKLFVSRTAWFNSILLAVNVLNKLSIHPRPCNNRLAKSHLIYESKRCSSALLYWAFSIFCVVFVAVGYLQPFWCYENVCHCTILYPSIVIIKCEYKHGSDNILTHLTRLTQKF